ncbi:hypothetical protein L210DRAFT_3551981 [Boletus edulis BED1]|uniref:Transmembrane protein n=1 Tax=Boletus edulis BED1 TaxID=1328754 RepID=A0AAD4GBE5_BOLED|nr:hypothetical protein L210DRAFT_3551981 [Boletus edulis BED1]
MHDHPVHMPVHTRGVEETYSQHNTPPVSENNGVAGTSNVKGKSSAVNLPSSNSGDDHEAQVNSDLFNAWMQRLQVLTVVTTFLASMDGELFALTALNTQIGHSVSTTARELVYACLAGALIFHICATSGEDDTKVGEILLFGLGTAQPQRLSQKIVLEAVRPLHWLLGLLQCPERFRFLSVRSSQVSSPPPLSLLTRCYYTTLCLTAAGFVLALTGILAYTWTGLRMSVGIFSTACLGVGISAGVWAIAM